MLKSAAALIFFFFFSGVNSTPFDHEFPECPVITEELRRNSTECVENACAGDLLCCQGYCVNAMEPRPRAKEGLCPQTRHLRKYQKSCTHDTDCPGKRKCCQVDAKTKCMDPNHILTIGYQRKDGHCPSVLPDHYMTAAKLCNGDADCFGSEKCCPTDLTFRCLGSHRRRAEPKEGSCKDAVPDKRPYSILGPLCEDDYDCIGMKKCCFNFLAEECMNPVL